MRLIRGLISSLRSVKEQYEAAHPPLHDAALDGDVRRMARLIADGADIHARSGPRWSALHWAVQSGSVNAVAVLLEHEAEIDAQDDRGRTALHYAAEGGNAPMAELLLEYGANPGSRDHEGRTPLAIATDETHDLTRKLLLLPSRKAVVELLQTRGGSC
jgi:ankyrin repeat protein